ncbi:MAG: DUF3137 domain-containing protein [Fimbriimonadales bacterium]
MIPNRSEALQELRPILEALDKERQELQKQFWRASLIVMGLVLVLGLLGALYFGALALGLALIAGVIGVAVVYSSTSSMWRQAFKNQLLTHLVKTVHPTLKYHPNYSISESEYHQSMLFHNSPDPDRYDGEDYIEGVIDKTDIRLSELHTQYRQVTYDSKGNRQERWVTIFRGLFISADFHKHFHGITLVFPDYEQRLLGGLGQWLQGLSAKIGSQPGELIKMEDPEFERLFKVYSTDPIEARYILTPNMITRLLDFQKRTKAEIRVSFVASRIYVALSTAHNHFEPPGLFASSERVVNPETLLQYFRELQFVVGIVDELNLNTRIWTKR